jgi:hypothetical protein
MMVTETAPGAGRVPSCSSRSIIAASTSGQPRHAIVAREMSLIAALASQGNSQDDSADSERRNPEPTSAPDQAFLRYKDRPITFYAGEQRGRVRHSPKQAYTSRCARHQYHKTDPIRPAHPECGKAKPYIEPPDELSCSRADIGQGRPIGLPHRERQAMPPEHVARRYGQATHEDGRCHRCRDAHCIPHSGDQKSSGHAAPSKQPGNEPALPQITMTGNSSQRQSSWAPCLPVADSG